jgi:hypothetical protein
MRKECLLLFTETGTDLDQREFNSREHLIVWHKNIWPGGLAKMNLKSKSFNVIEN